MADSVEKIMSRIKQLVIEIGGVKKEIGELHTATEVNRVG